MSREPDHEVVRNLFAEGNLTSLTSADWERLRVHLAECDTCTDELAELDPGLLLLSPITDAESMDRDRSRQVRALLLARAASETRGAGPGPGTSLSGAAAGRRVRRGEWVGWAVAAGMAALLLSHHAFHRPLNFGWLAAALFGILFVGASVYAVVQRERASALHERLASTERERQQSLSELKEHRQQPLK